MANSDSHQSPPLSSSSTAVSSNGNGSDATEQTPLLERSEDSKIKAVDHSLHEDVVVLQVGGEGIDGQEVVHVALTEEEQRRRLKWRIAKYIFWTVIGAVILGVFVKGWIDSGDTDVSSPLPNCGMRR
jgi:hypothetical protein